MNHSKRDILLKELLADESLEAIRRASLDQGLAIAQRRRRRANWTRGALMAAGLLAALWLAFPSRHHKSGRNQIAQGPVLPNGSSVKNLAPTPKAPAMVRIISDDELLALFPGRPRALIGPPGRKTLLFLEQSSTANTSELNR